DRQNHDDNKNNQDEGGELSPATAVSKIDQIAIDNQSTWVTRIARGANSWPIKRDPNDPLKERDRLAVRANNLATRTDANVEFHAQTTVEAIESLGQGGGFRVTCRSAGRPCVWEVERIIANIGYTPDNALYRELQVHECFAS